MLTVVILARNEAANLASCLKNLDFCDRILVVDDNSTDSTAKVARSLGAEVVARPLSGDFADQRNHALSLVKSGWALFIDADEVVSPALAAEIKKVLPGSTLHGYRLPRYDFMWDRALSRGDNRTILVRLGRPGFGKWVGRVHETWQIDGRIGNLQNPLHHYPHQSLYEFLDHLSRYSSLRARELADSGQSGSLARAVFYPPAKFIHLYLLKKGFLDGTAGFISAMSMAFYSFLTQSKLLLLGKGIGTQA